MAVAQNGPVCLKTDQVCMMYRPFSADQGVVQGSSRRPEFIGLVVIVLLSILPRLVFIVLFPTMPISDFRGLVDFAIAIRDSAFAIGTYHWEFFSAGLSTILSVIIRVFPHSPETTARWATAILTGLVPIFPYTIWRGVLDLRTRIFAGLLLAFWPGQIFFSGVVSQDNWVLIPITALSSLAVRSLVARDDGHPFWSAALFALGTFIRQEMIIVLIPVALTAAGLGGGNKHLRRHLFLWMAATLLLLLTIAGQRGVATGRFALTTEHGGKALLGAYVPGAALSYWINPNPYIVSIDPLLLRDKKRLKEEFYRLALKEALRRPKFHLVRMVSGILNNLGRPDRPNFYWSLSAPNVLPSEYKRRSDMFVEKISPFLDAFTVMIHAFFLASLLEGISRRNWPILAISATILLKIFVHAVIVAQPRYFMSVIALELLIIPLSVDQAIKSKNIGRSVLITVGAAAIIFLLAIVALKARAYILTQDDNIQREYRFSLSEPMGKGLLRCLVDCGRLSDLTEQSAQLELLNRDPSPGETAIAKCQLIGSGLPVPLSLKVMDPYAPGDFPDRIIQRVIVDGKELFRHDLAAQPGSGWFEIPLGFVGEGTNKSVLIEIIAVRPDPGWEWGLASRTTFQLAIKEMQ